VLVCLHGHNTDGKLWELLDAWAKQKQIAIVSPSLPGWGLTTANPGYLLREWVLDLQCLLNDELKIPSFHVMGASMGSAHAAAVASVFEPATSVRNVVLYVAFAPEDKAQGHDPFKGSMLKFFANMGPYPRFQRLFSKFLMDPLMRWFLPKDANTLRSIKWQWEGYMETCKLLSQPWPSSWTSMATRGGSRKVTVVSGTKDSMCPPHNQKRLVDLIKPSTLIEYDGDHGLGLEKPEMMANHLEQALR